MLNSLAPQQGQLSQSQLPPIIIQDNQKHAFQPLPKLQPQQTDKQPQPINDDEETNSESFAEEREVPFKFILIVI